MRATPTWKRWLMTGRSRPWVSPKTRYWLLILLAAIPAVYLLLAIQYSAITVPFWDHTELIHWIAGHPAVRRNRQWPEALIIQLRSPGWAVHAGDRDLAVGASRPSAADRAPVRSMLAGPKIGR
jgi:hypothetical protein